MSLGGTGGNLCASAILLSGSLGKSPFAPGPQGAAFTHPIDLLFPLLQQVAPPAKPSQARWRQRRGSAGPHLSAGRTCKRVCCGPEPLLRLGPQFPGPDLHDLGGKGICLPGAPRPRPRSPPALCQGKEKLGSRGPRAHVGLLWVPLREEAGRVTGSSGRFPPPDTPRFPPPPVQRGPAPAPGHTPSSERASNAAAASAPLCAPARASSRGAWLHRPPHPDSPRRSLLSARSGRAPFVSSPASLQPRAQPGSFPRLLRTERASAPRPREGGSAAEGSWARADRGGPGKEEKELGRGAGAGVAFAMQIDGKARWFPALKLRPQTRETLPPGVSNRGVSLRAPGDAGTLPPRRSKDPRTRRRSRAEKRGTLNAGDAPPSQSLQAE